MKKFVFVVIFFISNCLWASCNHIPPLCPKITIVSKVEIPDKLETGEEVRKLGSCIFNYRYEKEQNIRTAWGTQDDCSHYAKGYSGFAIFQRSCNDLFYSSPCKKPFCEHSRNEDRIYLGVKQFQVWNKQYIGEIPSQCMEIHFYKPLKFGRSEYLSLETVEGIKELSDPYTIKFEAYVYPLVEESVYRDCKRLKLSLGITKILEDAKGFLTNEGNEVQKIILVNKSGCGNDGPKHNFDRLPVASSVVVSMSIDGIRPRREGRGIANTIEVRSKSAIRPKLKFFEEFEVLSYSDKRTIEGDSSNVVINSKTFEEVIVPIPNTTECYNYKTLTDVVIFKDPGKIFSDPSKELSNFTFKHRLPCNSIYKTKAGISYFVDFLLSKQKNEHGEHKVFINQSGTAELRK